MACARLYSHLTIEILSRQHLNCFLFTVAILHFVSKLINSDGEFDKNETEEKKSSRINMINVEIYVRIKTIAAILIRSSIE